MTIHRAFAALLCAALFTACEEEGPQDLVDAQPESQVRFFNFGVNAPAVNFYANDQKITAVVSGTGTESTLGVAYGAVGLGGFYSSLEPGQYTFSGRIAATVDKDLAISNIPATLEDGKRYSLYQSGFYSTATKTVEGFVVEDNFAEAYDYTQAHVRFVNAISNSSPMALFATNTATTSELPVGALVAYKSAGAFTAIPTGVYTITTRVSGATTAAITRTAVSFSAGRIYTITARGDMTITSTTAVNRPFLDNTINR